MSNNSHETILTHIEYIRASQERTEQHLRLLNGRTGQNETRIAVLEERNPGKQGGIWGAIGGMLAGFAAGLIK